MSKGLDHKTPSKSQLVNWQKVNKSPWLMEKVTNSFGETRFLGAKRSNSFCFFSTIPFHQFPLTSVPLARWNLQSKFGLCIKDLKKTAQIKSPWLICSRKMTNSAWPWQFDSTKLWSWRVTSFTWSLVARLASKIPGNQILFGEEKHVLHFVCRNETSLVNLELIRGQDKVQQVIYGQEYKLRAYLSQPDGKQSKLFRIYASIQYSTSR